MDDDTLRTIRLLLARLERISADSVTAHRASGVRGALLRVMDQFESGTPVSGPELKRLVDNGYALLRRAAREKVRN